MSNGMDQYALHNVARGQADVFEQGQHAYRGTVSKFNGAGLSGRCRGKWGIFHADLKRWANSGDLTPGNTPFVAFQEHATAGNFILVFRTRHDAAQAALLTF